MKPLIEQRRLPSFTYCGLTIVVSKRSRFETKKLLQGSGAYYFESECLRPEINSHQCDIQLALNFKEFLPGTKVVLALGEEALRTITDSTHSLGDQRGSPCYSKHNGIPCVVSYHYQDACDIKADYERKYNTNNTTLDDEYEEDTEKADYLSDKSKGKTSRGNWTFWLKADTKKAIRILNNNGRIPEAKHKPEYILYPSSEEVIQVLTTTKDRDLYIDIETDIDTMDMRCFAFGFHPSKVYIVPTLDLNYKYAYSNLPHILRALAIAMRDNTTVAHNGSMFDYFVFAYKYNLAIGRKVYDTLVAQQRIYPEVEKSLGHCTSLWLYEPFHKGEGDHTYRTQQQADNLYKYCGKDVYTMILIKEAQLEFAKTIPGLTESIQQAQESIYPLFVCGLTGIRYDEELRSSMVQENDRLMKQYLRCISILTGPKVEPLISNQKCVKYFHDMLGYPAVARTSKGNPSFKADSLIKLRTKQENPVIDILLAYRARQAETSKALVFEKWL